MIPLDFILRRLGWEGQEERCLRDLGAFEGVWVQCRLEERLKLKKYIRGSWAVGDAWAVKCMWTGVQIFSTNITNWESCHIPTIPALVKQRQEDPGGLAGCLVLLN